MAYLRAYMAESRGSLPGRGPRAGDPFLGAIVGGLGIAKRALKKIAPKKFGGSGVLAVPRPTIGQLVRGTTKVFRGFGRNPMQFGPPIYPGQRRRYRRINPGNVKALRRAFRRVDAFGKLASKCGYVRRKTAHRTPKRKR